MDDRECLKKQPSTTIQELVREQHWDSGNEVIALGKKKIKMADDIEKNLSKEQLQETPLGEKLAILSGRGEVVKELTNNVLINV